MQGVEWRIAFATENIVRFRVLMVRQSAVLTVVTVSTLDA